MMTSEGQNQSTGVTMYQGQTVALLTKHEKEVLVCPILEPALGCNIQLATGFDTDELGTFTREILREGTQLETARKKARIGMELSGHSVGMASEGSFAQHPAVGIIPWNVEMIIWIDDVRQLEIVGVGQGSTNSSHALVKDWSCLKTFANQIGFPSHRIILRPDHDDHPFIKKDIDSWKSLKESYHFVRSQSEAGEVFAESDLRSHANPTRQKVIRAAAEDLLKKIRSVCPECGAPGFSIVDVIRGLPCCDCGAPTRDIVSDIYECQKCAHRVLCDRTEFSCADPFRCDYCNP
ncbi:DUF6671 family protein [Acidithiobacillus sulfuriphilus]|uniref:DUF6671 family protein n=1 Tax=Acidithiobacillus sulfuriphilus TaxID=1867749 RepID=UPI003F5DE578